MSAQEQQLNTKLSSLDISNAGEISEDDPSLNHIKKKILQEIILQV